ncbi:MBL fold metallo-hydrolase [Novosphingobium sp. PY1]|uniref:MBL fold metallo-hydrolase n=1 Tax=Novosphingobium sp. PY1 TaxID=1882221 RepID=UPI001A8FED26|nr:MBL fold metallo-hydrolase [Novosphingobium sp. PY1]GFM30285.1 Beta-lactamase [Novosphingobium sp. PY1]
MIEMADNIVFSRWQIGDVRISRVIEVEKVTLPPDLLLQIDTATVQKYDWLIPDHADADGNIMMNIQAFLLEVGGMTIMVDPCLGNGKDREGAAIYHMRDGPFLKHLEQAGFPPESIDVVLCTHLHFDHVGWNTRLVDGQWTPTFPNARYLFAKGEFEAAKADTWQTSINTFEDSIQPILDAGLADFVEVDHRVCDEISLVPTPGHTEGHCSIRISSKGEYAVITGDMIHHPVQARHTKVCSHVCVDPIAADETRRSFLNEWCDNDVLVLGSHFSGPTGLHFEPDVDGWKIKDQGSS